MVAGCDNCGKPPELTRYLYLQLDQGEEGGAQVCCGQEGLQSQVASPGLGTG